MLRRFSPFPALRLYLAAVCVSACLSPLLSGRAACQAAKLFPVDQAAADSSFLAFREKFFIALKEHDSRFVYGCLDPEVIYSFPPFQGEAGFRSQWKLEDSASPFWAILDSLLALGGGFIREGLFAAPYVTFAWPAELDAESYTAIIEKEAPVRAAPSKDAELLAVLSSDIVKTTAGGAVLGEWLEIELADGRTGYVEKRLTRRATDYRAVFEKQDGVWKLKFFLYGN